MNLNASTEYVWSYTIKLYLSLGVTTDKSWAHSNEIGYAQFQISLSL